MPGVDTVSIFVADDAEESLVAQHVSGSCAQHIELLAIPIGERMSGWVAASGQSMVNADAALDVFDVQAGSLRSALAVPCEGPDGHRAVITLYSTRTSAFSPAHQRLVEAAVARISAQGAARVLDIRQEQRRPRPTRSLTSAKSVSLQPRHVRAR